MAWQVSGDALEAIRDAHDRLFTIKISVLDEGDMANNQDSGLFAKTEKSGTGECDAFLSHSWRDHAASKWQKMIEFKSEFEAKHRGDEPRCWLDKVLTTPTAPIPRITRHSLSAPRPLSTVSQACIDQDGDINASLRALPIFLLASRYFVVFIGESYFSRMWCVLELFTFLKMGASLDRVKLVALHGTRDQALERIHTFDVRGASCRITQRPVF